MTTAKHDKEYTVVTSGTASKPSNIAMATAVSIMSCDSSKEPQDASSPRQRPNTNASTGTVRGTHTESQFPHRHEQVDIAQNEDVSIVVKVQSTEVAIAVNRLGATVQVFDTSSAATEDGNAARVDNNTAPTPGSQQGRAAATGSSFMECESAEVRKSVPSVSVATVPTTPRKKDNTGRDRGGCQVSSPQAVTLDAGPTVTPPAKVTVPAVSQMVDLTVAPSDGSRHTRPTGSIGTGQPSKLLVDITARTSLPGNQPCREKLARHCCDFVQGSEDQKSDILATHFLKCFIFQKPSPNGDVLTLGTASAVRMLSRSLTEAGKRQQRRDRDAATARSTAVATATTAATPATNKGESPKSQAHQKSSKESAMAVPETTPPVVYCSHAYLLHARLPGNIAFRQAIQLAHAEYRNCTSKSDRGSIVDRIAQQFQFLRPASDKVNGEAWDPACPLQIRTKIQHALGYEAGREEPDGDGHDMTNVTPGAEGERIAISADTTEKGGASKKLVVHCGAGKFRDRPGNQAYKELIASGQEQYFATASTLNRQLMIASIQERFDFQQDGQSLPELFVRRKIQTSLCKAQLKADGKKRKALETESLAVRRQIKQCRGGNTVDAAAENAAAFSAKTTNTGAGSGAAAGSHRAVVSREPKPSPASHCNDFDHDAQLSNEDEIETLPF